MFNHNFIAEEVLFKLNTPSFPEIDSQINNDDHWEILDTDEQDYHHCGHWFRGGAEKKINNSIHVTPIYYH